MVAFQWLFAWQWWFDCWACQSLVIPFPTTSRLLLVKFRVSILMVDNCWWTLTCHHIHQKEIVSDVVSCLPHPFSACIISLLIFFPSICLLWLCIVMILLWLHITQTIYHCLPLYFFFLVQMVKISQSRLLGLRPEAFREAEDKMWVVHWECIDLVIVLCFLSPFPKCSYVKFSCNGLRTCWLGLPMLVIPTSCSLKVKHFWCLFN